MIGGEEGQSLSCEPFTPLPLHQKLHKPTAVTSEPVVLLKPYKPALVN